VRRKSYGAEDAEGLRAEKVQSPDVRAWRHAETYDPRRGRVLNWLLGIARNVAIDAVRLKRADPLDPDVLAAAVLAKGDADPGDATGFADRQRIREAMRALPADQRRALFLSAYLGRTASEIGVLEDIPLGTAKTRIRSAMIRLRAELGVADER